MIIELKDKRIEESVKHLKKAIEIVGGKEYLDNFNNDSEFIEDIINNVFLKGQAILYIGRICSKIKEYNTLLESKIRKFKKSNSIEEFREIVDEIEDRYKWEFDNFFLMYIDNLDENKNYYGEYLTEKKKQIIDSVLMNLGI